MDRTVSANLADIHNRIHLAGRRRAGDSNLVALMAVSKTFPPEAILEAYAAGQRLFGESKVQEFADKAEALAGLKDAEFHMIGHLQSNRGGEGS